MNKDTRTINYGLLTSSAFGVLLKELMSRALVIAQTRRFGAEVFSKMGATGKMDDVVTAVDIEIQNNLLRWIPEFFGPCNIIAEEDNVRVWIGDDLVTFVFDAIDGTKAITRQQSFGIASQICAVYDGQIIAACIVDVNTGELFYFRPESPNVHRLIPSKPPYSIKMTIDPGRSLLGQNLLLRDLPTEKYYSPFALSMLFGEESQGRLPLFKDGQTSNGSFALSCTLMMKGEVGGIIVRPGLVKPWDELPPAGLLSQMGFTWIAVDPMGTLDVMPQTAAMLHEHRIDHEVLIVHGSRVNEVLAWAA